MYYYDGQRGPRPRPTSVTPFRGFLRWVARVMFRPTPVMLEVTYEVPLLRSLGLLAVIYLANVVGLGAIGQEGLVNFGGGGFAAQLQNGLVGTGVVALGLAVYVVITHYISRTLEGQGSLPGTIAGAVFSLVPFLPFAGVSLLLALMPIGDAKAVFQSLALFVALGWTAFLYSVALKENNTFTDIQAVISMLLPPAVITVGVGVLFVIGYLVIILVL